MRTVQDITGNFLNNLHFFTLQIEKNNRLTPESAAKLDELIHDTSQRLNKLGDLEEIREKKMAGDMIGIEYEHSLINEATIQRNETHENITKEGWWRGKDRVEMLSRLYAAFLYQDWDN